MGQVKSRMFGPGRIGRAVLALGAAVVLAGCSAGQITQTSSQLPAVNGDVAAAADLRVSNAAMSFPKDAKIAAYPKGADVALVMSIANDGDKDDVLQSVSSPQASSVSITGDKNVPAHSRLSVGQPFGSAPASVQAAEDEEETGSVKIVLKGIKAELRPGMTVEVTLKFRDAGPVVLRLPMEAPERPRTAEKKHEGEGAH